jgi:hypothetical protein
MRNMPSTSTKSGDDEDGFEGAEAYGIDTDGVGAAMLFCDLEGAAVEAVTEGVSLAETGLGLDEAPTF